MEPLSDKLQAKHDQLLEILRSYGSVAVAFSGGIDSTVVAKAAQLALGDKAVAVTAVSQSLASGEKEEAEELARLIGIRHELIETEEFEDPDYLKNAPDRCYHCKTELYTQLDGLVPRLGVNVVVNGANTDDRGDWRPGMKAASEHAVQSPLLEAEISKADLRELARHWGLPTWDKPATPCLSSRIAYGEEVTPERVRRVDQAEAFLRERGFRFLRVRYHKGDLARIEVPLDELPKLADATLRAELTKRFKELGFKFITLDLEGFRSGSLNEVLPIESLGMVKR